MYSCASARLSCVRKRTEQREKGKRPPLICLNLLEFRTLKMAGPWRISHFYLYYYMEDSSTINFEVDSRITHMTNSHKKILILHKYIIELLDARYYRN